MIRKQRRPRERRPDEVYREARLFAWIQGGPSHFGMAKVGGTVLFPRLHDTRDALMADIRARVDAYRSRVAAGLIKGE